MDLYAPQGHIYNHRKQESVGFSARGPRSSFCLQAGAFGQLCSQSQILALEDDVRDRGIKKCLASRCSSDGETEWVRNVVELYRVGSCDVTIGRRARQNLIRYLIDLRCCILYLDMETSALVGCVLELHKRRRGRKLTSFVLDTQN
jgi:hypothetical protein